MKNIKVYLYAASVVACSGLTFNAAAAESPAVAEEPAPAPPAYRPWIVGIEAGTQGLLGTSASWRFSDHLGVRLGADYTEWSFSDVKIGGTHYDARVRLLAEPLTCDFYPWQNSSFRASLGLLFNQNELTGSASHSGITIIDGQPFPTDQVGSLNLRIRQPPVNPYLSISGNLFYFDHAHHWALGGELGVAYTGDAEASVTRSGAPSPLIDAAVRRAQKRAQDYADQLKFWPVAKIMVTFSF